MGSLIGSALQARGVSRLVHVTAAARLPRILYDGALLPGDDGVVYLSIEYPFTRLVADRQWRDGWGSPPVALVFDVLAGDAASFVCDRDSRDAASQWFGGSAGVACLYAPVVGRARRTSLLPAHVPTHDGAEVIVEGPLSLRYLLCVVVRSHLDVPVLPAPIPVIERPAFLDPEVWRALRVGRAPELGV